MSEEQNKVSSLVEEGLKKVEENLEQAKESMQASKDKILAKVSDSLKASDSLKKEMLDTSKNTLSKIEERAEQMKEQVSEQMAEVKEELKDKSQDLLTSVQEKKKNFVDKTLPQVKTEVEKKVNVVKDRLTDETSSKKGRSSFLLLLSGLLILLLLIYGIFGARIKEVLFPGTSTSSKIGSNLDGQDLIIQPSPDNLGHPANTLKTKPFDPEVYGLQTLSAEALVGLPYLDGGNVTVEDLDGKVVVVNFWASWCTYCKQEMPGFQKLYDQIKDDDNIVLLMVNVGGGGETREAAIDYLEENNFAMPVVLDEEGALYHGLGFTGLPTSVIIAKDGIPLPVSPDEEASYFIPGFLPEEFLFNLVNSALSIDYNKLPDRRLMVEEYLQNEDANQDQESTKQN